MSTVDSASAAQAIAEGNNPPPSTGVVGGDDVSFLAVPPTIHPLRISWRLSGPISRIRLTSKLPRP